MFVSILHIMSNLGKPSRLKALTRFSNSEWIARRASLSDLESAFVALGSARRVSTSFHDVSQAVCARARSCSRQSMFSRDFLVKACNSFFASTACSVFKVSSFERRFNFSLDSASWSERRNSRCRHEIVLPAIVSPVQRFSKRLSVLRRSEISEDCDSVLPVVPGDVRVWRLESAPVLKGCDHVRGDEGYGEIHTDNHFQVT